MIFLCLLAIAILNYARGTRLFGLTSSTSISRIVVSFAMAIVSYIMGYDILDIPIILAGIYVWSVPGWGKYFSSFMGNYNKDDREIGWIDYIGDNLIIATDEKSNRVRGLVCMCLRGIYMYPLFIALYLSGHPMAPIFGMGCLLQGIPYWLAKYAKDAGKNPLSYAEPIWGYFMGLMLWSVL